MNQFSKLLAGALLVSLQGCATTPEDDADVAVTSEQALTGCSTANGKWPMAAALAVAIATEIGEIDVVRDFGFGTGVWGNSILTVTTPLCSSSSACPNIKAILSMQELPVNGPGGLTQWMFDANIFANALVNMRLDQVNWENNLKQNQPAVYAELAAGHTLKKTSAFSPVASQTCGKYYYYKAYKKGTTTALTNPSYLQHRLWAFGNTSNPYLAFSYSTTEAKISIDPDDTANTTPAASGTCTTYTLDKVYDPTHKLIGQCCTVSATGQAGTLQIGLSPAIRWDFCVAS